MVYPVTSSCLVNHGIHHVWSNPVTSSCLNYGLHHVWLILWPNHAWCIMDFVKSGESRDLQYSCLSNNWFLHVWMNPVTSSYLVNHRIHHVWWILCPHHVWWIMDFIVSCKFCDLLMAGKSWTSSCLVNPETSSCRVNLWLLHIWWIVWPPHFWWIKDLFMPSCLHVFMSTCLHVWRIP